MPRQDQPNTQIAVLRALDLGALRERWIEQFGVAPSCRISKDLLVRSVAYRFQEKACGALSKSTRRKLARLAEELTEHGSIRGTTSVPLKTGTKLVRVWKGKVHEVTILEGGYVWSQKRYRSLSEIARAITGTRWSGPRFFGTEASQQTPTPRRLASSTAVSRPSRPTRSTGGTDHG
jgi:Protein of unknown function (DUF2924)